MTRTLLALGCLVLLSGCGMDMNNLLSFGDRDEDTVTAEPAAPPTPVAAAAPSNDAFCRAVATQDATSNGFDPATQQKVAVSSYTQCLTIYAPR